MLSEYNFVIKYQSRSRNAKTDALTRKSDDKSTDQNDERLTQQHQTILTPNRLDISDIEVNDKISIFNRVIAANKNDETCNQMRQAIAEGRRSYQRCLIKNCFLENGVLYYLERI